MEQENHGTVQWQKALRRVQALSQLCSQRSIQEAPRFKFNLKVFKWHPLK